MLLHWGVARLAAIVYFVQGSLGIAGIALPLYLRDQGFSVSKITFITSIAAAPWFFKIVYGAISDAVPIFGLRRKPYLIICSVLSCMGWVMLGLLPPDEKWLILSLMVTNLGLAATDVITDGLVVEYSRAGTAQTYQGIAWGARSIGALISGYLGGVLAGRLLAQNVFLITSALPLISLLAALFLREKPHPHGREVYTRNILKLILESFRCIFEKNLKWFILLLLIITSSAAIATPFFFYLRETLKFDQIFLGVLSSVTWFGAIVGCFVFLKFFKKTPLRQTLYWVVGIGFADVLLTLAIRDPLSAFAISFFLGVFGYMVLLPVFSTAARLAHATGVEGSLYAILMSLFNVGQAIAGVCGGILYEWMGLRPLIVLTAFLGLSAYLVLPRLKTM